MTFDLHSFPISLPPPPLSHLNTHPHTAFPIANLSTPAKYVSHLGTNATINCAFRAGALIDRYQVNWFKGLQKLNSDSTVGKYIILRNFSLVITNLTVDDAGRGYYCSVTVTNISSVIHRLGPSVELEVYGRSCDSHVIVMCIG